MRSTTFEADSAIERDLPKHCAAERAWAVLALMLSMVLSLALFAAGHARGQEADAPVSGSLGLAVTTLRHQSGAGSLLAVQDNLLNASWLRISGREDLGSQLEALFRFEAGVGPDTGTVGSAGSSGTRVWNRQSWVGLRSASLGQLTLGRQFHVANERFIRSFDAYNAVGSSPHVVPFFLFGVNRYSGNDSRADNTIKIRMAVPGLLELGLSGALGEDTAGRSHSVDVALVRKNVEVAVVHVRHDAATAVVATGALPRHRLLIIGDNAAVGPVRVYLARSESTLDATLAGRQTQKNRLTSMGLNWTLAPWGHWKAAVYDDEARHLNGVPGRDGIKRTWVMSAHNDLSRRTELSAAVFRNRFTDGYLLEPINLGALGRDPAQSSEGAVSLGIRYTF